MKNIIYIFCAILMSVAFNFAYSQSSFEKPEIKKAKEFLSLGDHMAVIEGLLPLAQSGDAVAQYYIGRAYAMNNFFIPDENSAIWYLKSGKQGYFEAQYELIKMYAIGNGVNKDDEAAKIWADKAIVQYEKLANNGEAKAQHVLGELYYVGWGVDADYEKAMAWYYKAAAQNYADAQYALGEVYQNGIGVDRSAQKAIYWYGLAKKNGRQDAAEAQKSLEYYIQSLLSQGQIMYQAKDFKGALENFIDASLYDIADASFAAGLFYSQGIGTKKNIDSAIFYLQRAAKQGHPRGQLELGKIYMGTGKYDDASMIFYQLGERALKGGDFNTANVALKMLDALGKEKKHNRSRAMAQDLRRLLSR